jgi:DNA-binding MarR family transcriptional regulator
MAKEKDPQVQELVASIRLLIRAVYYDTVKFSKSFGLTGPQSAVLRILQVEGPMSSAGLSRKLYVTPSNITGIIDRLVKKGYVERVREEKDRRVVLIALTEEGDRIAGKLPDPIESILADKISSMSPEQVRTLNESMREVLRMLDAKAADRKLNELSAMPAEWVMTDLGGK